MSTDQREQNKAIVIRQRGIESGNATFACQRSRIY